MQRSLPIYSLCFSFLLCSGAVSGALFNEDVSLFYIFPILGFVGTCKCIHVHIVVTMVFVLILYFTIILCMYFLSFMCVITVVVAIVLAFLLAIVMMVTDVAERAAASSDSDNCVATISLNAGSEGALSITLPS